MKPGSARPSHTLNMMNLYPSTTIAKFLFKAPLLFWRLGLGPISGKIFMLLTTTGRKSGLPRRTSIEYHPLNGKKYAVSAFGERAAWYLNLLADERVTIQTSDGTQSARAYRVTDEDELLAVYRLLRRRDPPLMLWYLRSLDIQDSPQDILENKHRLHWVGFVPTEYPTPAGVEVDLAWLWPVGFIIWGLVCRLNRRR